MDLLWAGTSKMRVGETLRCCQGRARMTKAVCAIFCLWAGMSPVSIGAEDLRLPVNVASAAVIALDDDTLILPIRQGLLKYVISTKALTKFIDLGNDPEIPKYPYISDGEYNEYDRYTEPVFEHYDPTTKILYITCVFSPKTKYIIGPGEKERYYRVDLGGGSFEELDYYAYSKIMNSNSFDASFDIGKNYKRIYIYECLVKNREDIFFDRPLLPKYFLGGQINFGLEHKGITTKEDQDFRLRPGMILTDQKDIFVYGTDSKTTTMAYFHGIIDGNTITFSPPFFSWVTGKNEKYYDIAYNMSAFSGYLIDNNLYFMGEGVITRWRRVKNLDPILGMGYRYVIEGGHLIRKYRLGDPPGVTTVVAEYVESNYAYSFYILNDKLYYFKFMGAEKPLGLFVKDLKE
jgi:hypothetical protein